MGALILPGQQFAPRNFGDQMVLFSALNRVEAVVDGAPVGKFGRLYIVEPQKPVRVPYEAGRFILEHLTYTGVVRVREEESDEGVKYDVKSAVEESLKLTEEQDKARFERYVAGVVDDFVKKNKPVPQPDPAILAIIERRGYDLKDYGINPIGWKEPDKDARVSQLETMLKAMQEQIESLSGKKAKGKE
jgi:hypothetical protein